MHPEFLPWLKSNLRAYSGDGHHSFYWAYRNTVQRISVALRAALALSFSHLEDRQGETVSECHACPWGSVDYSVSVVWLLSPSPLSPPLVILLS